MQFVAVKQPLDGQALRSGPLASYFSQLIQPNLRFLLWVPLRPFPLELDHTLQAFAQRFGVLEEFPDVPPRLRFDRFGTVVLGVIAGLLVYCETVPRGVIAVPLSGRVAGDQPTLPELAVLSPPGLLGHLRSLYLANCSRIPSVNSPNSPSALSSPRLLRVRKEQPCSSNSCCNR
jgi:hypothetical protein